MEYQVSLVLSECYNGTKQILKYKYTDMFVV